MTPKYKHDDDVMIGFLVYKECSAPVIKWGYKVQSVMDL